MEDSASRSVDPGTGVSEGVARLVADFADRVFAKGRDSVPLEAGLAAILVPRFDGPVLRRLLMPRLAKPFFRIRLDRSGSFVWNMLDGRTPVRSIFSAYRDAFPSEPHPEARVALFLRMLALQGHAVEVDPESPACQSGDAG